MRKEMSAASILFALVAGVAAGTPPTPGPSCSAKPYRQFDFWVGDWNVTQNGKPAGTNRIERILEGCALLENWVGVRGLVGHSLNYYDATRGVWHQTWVDNQAGALELEGKLEHGAMVLAGSRLDAASGKTIVSRLTWTPNPDGSVRQHWEMSSDGGKTWTTEFDGLYEKK
jgi:hypothetical protein